MREMLPTYERWRVVADRNADGALTASDAQAWAEWLFYLPGEALVGAPRALEVSAVIWVLAALAVYYAWTFLIDAFDPTFRAQRRERRRAQRVARRRRSARPGGLWS